MKCLYFKTSTNTISQVSPSPKGVVQKELSVIGRMGYVAAHVQARDSENIIGTSEGALYAQNRIDWAHGVIDWNNITDKEFEDLVHTTTPSDHKYAYWIDDADVKESKEYRDAWEDIGPTGTVTINLEKARTIQLARNAILQSQLDAAAKVNTDPLASADIESIDDILALKTKEK